MDVLNYGGGWQTVGICILIEQGKLPKPDRIIIADTGREKQSTWDYLEANTRPHMEAIGLSIEIAPHSLATVDIYSHQGTLLLPVYGPTSKMTAFCSSEWKARVIDRYIRQSGGPVASERTHWIGFAYDEKRRIKGEEGRIYPLVDAMLTRADIRKLVLDAGWPEPTSSSCWMCPNMTNAQWAEMRDNRPQEFEQALAMDVELREMSMMEHGIPVYLHVQRKPLAEIDLDEPDRESVGRQCGLGLCMI